MEDFRAVTVAGIDVPDELGEQEDLPKNPNECEDITVEDVIPMEKVDEKINQEINVTVKNDETAETEDIEMEDISDDTSRSPGALQILEEVDVEMKESNEEKMEIIPQGKEHVEPNEDGPPKSNTGIVEEMVDNKDNIKTEVLNSCYKEQENAEDEGELQIKFFDMHY